MKNSLKTLALTCIAVCMIVCVTLFATACTDTSKYTVTVVTADGSPVNNLMIQFCDSEMVSCKTPTTDENGKVVIDISQTPDAKEYSIHILGDYVLEDGTNETTVKVSDGYSVTLTVKAK